MAKNTQTPHHVQTGSSSAARSAKREFINFRSAFQRLRTMVVSIGKKQTNGSTSTENSSTSTIPSYTPLKPDTNVLNSGLAIRAFHTIIDSALKPLAKAPIKADQIIAHQKEEIQAHLGKMQDALTKIKSFNAPVDLEGTLRRFFATFKMTPSAAVFLSYNYPALISQEANLELTDDLRTFLSAANQKANFVLSQTKFEELSDHDINEIHSQFSKDEIHATKNFSLKSTEFINFINKVELEKLCRSSLVKRVKDPSNISNLSNKNLSRLIDRADHAKHLSEKLLQGDPALYDSADWQQRHQEITDLQAQTSLEFITRLMVEYNSLYLENPEKTAIIHRKDVIKLLNSALPKLVFLKNANQVNATAAENDILQEKAKAIGNALSALPKDELNQIIAGLTSNNLSTLQVQIHLTAKEPAQLMSAERGMRTLKLPELQTALENFAETLHFPRDLHALESALSEAKRFNMEENPNNRALFTKLQKNFRSYWNSYLGPFRAAACSSKDLEALQKLAETHFGGPIPAIATELLKRQSAPNSKAYKKRFIGYLVR